MTVRIHEALAKLTKIHGESLLRDPVAFRSALDDYLDEGAASLGTVKLLTDAIGLGAAEGVLAMLDDGATIEAAVDTVGNRIARDRGSSDVAGARWACAALAFALGRAPASLAERLQPTTSANEAIPAPETVLAPVRIPDPLNRPAPSAESPSRRGRAWTLGIVVVVLLAVVAWIGWTFLGDDDESPSATDDDNNTSQPRSGADDEVEVLERTRVDVLPSAVEARFQFAIYQGDPYIVMQLETDGAFHMAANVQIACDFESGSTDVRLEADQDYEDVEPDTGQGYVGWVGPDGETAYSSYYGWDVKKRTLELFGDTPEEGCAAAS